MQPISVRVHCSESPWFKQEEYLYGFKEFENIAALAATRVKAGYDKTVITVFFSTEQEDRLYDYKCRLDLAINGDKGFCEHTVSVLRFIASDQFNELDTATQADYKELETFLRQIKWPSVH
jgi:hypothetical protein